MPDSLRCPYGNAPPFDPRLLLDAMSETRREFRASSSAMEGADADPVAGLFTFPRTVGRPIEML